MRHADRTPTSPETTASRALEIWMKQVSRARRTGLDLTAGFRHAPQHSEIRDKTWTHQRRGGLGSVYYEVPAVVILGGLNSLGVSRSLGAGNVTSYTIDTRWLNPGMWSRYTNPVRSNSLEGEPLVQTLAQLQAKLGGRPVLFNTHELAVLALSEHRDCVNVQFRFRLPRHEIVLVLQDKARFHEFATSAGLPVPPGAVLRSQADIAKKLSASSFPLVIKPADKASVHRGTVRGIAVCRSAREAVIACERVLEIAGEVLVQEWVDGRNDEIYFCLFYRGRNGQIVSMFTGRKLASSPPGIGLTAFCAEAAETRQILEPMTEAFLETVDYAGMGSMEYKWDRTNRRFVIIEPTVGRTDWQEEIATLCGVNIPLEAYRHELELPPEPRLRSSTGRIVWRASIWERLKTERPTLPRNAVIYDGYWRLDDPMPGLIQYSCGAVTTAFRQLQKHIPH